MSVGTVYDTAYKGDFNQVKVKIDENKSLVNIADQNGRLLIHWAALGGNENLVEYLIESGSPVDPLDDTNSTPLVLAASAGRYEVVRLLIGRGANVNHKTSRGQSALLYACSKGHKEVVKLLIDFDADVNNVDILGATPLHRAASQGRTNIVELLLSSSDLNLDVCDSTGSTPLNGSYYIGENVTANARLVVHNGSEHLACEEDREAVATLLVKNGANFDAKNREKKSPADLCSPKLRNALNNLMV